MSGDRFKFGPFEAVRFHGEDEAGEWTPYMEKWGLHLGPLGSVWLHHFFRGDADRDPHDHPWPFWTFPLTTYVEEVRTSTDAWEGEPFALVYRHKVDRFRVHFRPAAYAHRVIGPWNGREEVCRCGSTEAGYGWPCNMGGCLFEPEARAGSIWTIVFHRPRVRKWGFWKLREGRWCWNSHQYYAHEGGKTAPCDEGETEKAK